MEAFANPFTQILFVLTLVVISLSVISIRIQKANKLQRKSFEQSQVRTDTDYSSIGVFFQGDRTLVKCPSCAELISIEAKICKACRTNVEKYVAEVQSKLTPLEEENLKIKTKQKAENIKKVIIYIPLVVLLWVTFQIGLELSERNSYYLGAPPTVPIFFVIISILLLWVLPKITNNSQFGLKSRQKLRIIKAVIWSLVLAGFLIYSYDAGSSLSDSNESKKSEEAQGITYTKEEEKILRDSFIDIWKKSLIECGFEKEIIVDDTKYKLTTPGFSFYFEEKWQSKSIKQEKMCLTQKLNRFYAEYNAEQKRKGLQGSNSWSYGTYNSDVEKAGNDESLYVVGSWTIQ